MFFCDLKNFGMFLERERKLHWASVLIHLLLNRQGLKKRPRPFSWDCDDDLIITIFTSPFSALNVINKFLPQCLPVQILFFKFLFSLTNFSWKVCHTNLSLRRFSFLFLYFQTILCSVLSFSESYKKEGWDLPSGNYYENLLYCINMLLFFLANSNTKQWYWNRCQTKQGRKQC